MPAPKDRRFYQDFRQIQEKLAVSFRNKTPLVTIGTRGFTITDIAALGIQSKTNIYLIGSRGTGKTLLAEAIRRSIFNDEGFYLRGDINLQLKDLLVKLDLQGKSEDEVYRIADDRIRFNFALIDELNRVPGVLQNQFLNILDGYIEIRGRKYVLGNRDYLLMVATGNPPTDGEYTGVFDEDLALLDRIPLIVNTDEIPLEKGDVFSISEADMDKDKIPQGDLRNSAIQSYRYLRERIREDPEVNTVSSLLKEFVYNLFRYVEIGKIPVDKAQKKTWRDALQASGDHSAGTLVSYCSDISVRTLQGAGKLAFAMYSTAEIEEELLRGASGESGVPGIGIDDFIRTYLEALKLALNYDRRFIPADLPEQLGRTHADMLATVFADVSGRIDPGRFTTAAVLLMEFSEFARKRNEKGMGDMITFASSGTKDNPVLAAAVSIMEAKLREKREGERSDYIGSVLGGENASD